MFSAKEAAYKAINTITGLYIGFHEAEIILDIEAGAFRFDYIGNDTANRVADQGSGTWRVWRDHVLTTFVIAA